MPGSRATLVYRCAHSITSAAVELDSHLKLLGGHFFKMGEQFVFAGPIHEIELNHFPSSFVGFTAGPQYDQQAGDQCGIGLQGDAVGVLEQQVPTAENAFEPAKEEFRLPAIMPPKMELYRAPKTATLPPPEPEKTLHCYLWTRALGVVNAIGGLFTSQLRRNCRRRRKRISSSLLAQRARWPPRTGSLRAWIQ